MLGLHSTTRLIVIVRRRRRRLCVCVSSTFSGPSLPFDPPSPRPFIISPSPLRRSTFSRSQEHQEKKEKFISNSSSFSSSSSPEEGKRVADALLPSLPISLKRKKQGKKSWDRKGKLFYLRKEGGRGRKEPGRSREKCLHSVWRRRERSPREPARVYRGTEGEKGQKE